MITSGVVGQQNRSLCELRPGSRENFRRDRIGKSVGFGIGTRFTTRFQGNAQRTQADLFFKTLMDALQYGFFPKFMEIARTADCEFCGHGFWFPWI